MTNITHVCTMCDHKMTKFEIIEFMGTTQCPNCFRDDFIVPIDEEEGENKND